MEVPPNQSSENRGYKPVYTTTNYSTAFFSGVVAGSVAELLAFPFEVGPALVKTQSHVDAMLATQAAATAVSPGNANGSGPAKQVGAGSTKYWLRVGPKHYLDLVATRGELKGVLVKKVPISACIMASYDLFRLEFRRMPILADYSNYTVCFLAGMSAQCLEALIATPVHNVKQFVSEVQSHAQQLQQLNNTPASSYSGKPKFSFAAARDYVHIVGSGSRLSLLKGYWTTVIEGAPFLAFYYMFSEQALTHFTKLRLNSEQNNGSSSSSSSSSSLASASTSIAPPSPPSDGPPMADIMAAGACGAIAALIITTPLEVMRKQLVFAWGNLPEANRIYHEEGLSGLLRALREKQKELPRRIIALAPRSAIKKATFGFVKKVIPRILRAVARRR